MKLVKSLLLASAAALVGSVSANAADLPAAEPAEYVKVCDAYGAGYFFIPGTDTCLRVSGYVRAQTTMATNGYGSDVAGSVDGQMKVSNVGPFTNDAVNFGTRGLLRFDARSRTDMGILRSFIEVTTDNSYDGATALTARYAFVQFAGLTAGLTDSFFNGDNAPLALNDVVADRSSRRNLIAYTANFGNGFSGTVSLEDADGLHTVTNTGRTRMPEIVGNLRLQQGWGAAWLSAAFSQTTTTTAGIANNGWAISAGTTIKLDQVSKGDVLFLKGTYADGATQYLYAGSIAPFFNDAGVVRTNTGYALFGEFVHFWTPTVRSGLYANYVNVDRATVAIAANDAKSTYAVGLNTVWSPVKGLDLGAEVFYVNTTKYNAAAAVATTAHDGWGGIVRVQRSF